MYNLYNVGLNINLEFSPIVQGIWEITTNIAASTTTDTATIMDTATTTDTATTISTCLSPPPSPVLKSTPYAIQSNLPVIPSISPLESIFFETTSSYKNTLPVFKYNFYTDRYYCLPAHPIIKSDCNGFMYLPSLLFISKILKFSTGILILIIFYVIILCLISIFTYILPYLKNFSGRGISKASRYKFVNYSKGVRNKYTEKKNSRYRKGKIEGSGASAGNGGDDGNGGNNGKDISSIKDLEFDAWTNLFEILLNLLQALLAISRQMANNPNTVSFNLDIENFTSQLNNHLFYVEKKFPHYLEEYRLIINRLNSFQSITFTNQEGQNQIVVIVPTNNIPGLISNLNELIRLIREILSYIFEDYADILDEYI